MMIINREASKLAASPSLSLFLSFFGVFLNLLDRGAFPMAIARNLDSYSLADTVESHGTGEHDGHADSWIDLSICSSSSNEWMADFL